jgi:hypothetical protein
MRGFKSWVSNILIGANMLLLFLTLRLDKVDLPAFLSWSGQFHPLILHLPLGIAFFSLLLWFIRGYFLKDALYEIYNLTLAISALTAVFTGLLGIFLSKGQAYEPILLRNHLWSGVAFSLFSWFSWWAFTNVPRLLSYWTYLQCMGFVIMIYAGHAGGSLTHGSDFLHWPDTNEMKKDDFAQISDSSSYFQAAIRPVLEKKCVSCHKKEKAKGDLILASNPNVTSNVWIANHEKENEMLAALIYRIDLPVTDKKHMPPRGKDPLEPYEINLLKNWVKAGGSTSILLSSITENHPLFIDKNQLLSTSSKEKAYDFPFLSPKKLATLNDAFTVVRQISNESPALKADFFIRKSFDIKKLQRLSDAKQQIVQINLSKMPIRDADLEKLAIFQQLEKLFLNQTDITDNGIPALKKLKNVKVLSLSGTMISKKSIPVLASMSSLKEVYLWHTNITALEYQSIIKKYKHIRWFFGFSPNPDDILPLNGPILENKSLVLAQNDSIRIKKSIPGSIIRYTIDGKTPDSLTGLIYTGPLFFSKPVSLAVKIFKSGWISSPTYTFSFFREGIKPDSARLITLPEPEYVSAGATSLTDNQLGKIDQFRAGNWLGYRNNRLEALFRFKAKDIPLIKYVSVHYGINVQSYIVAPQYVELWGGAEENKLTLLDKQRLSPLVKEKLNEVGTNAVFLEIKDRPTKYYKVIVKPVASLPSFHPGKGDKGWVFIDEIFFNK